jgi:protein ImuA
MPLADLPRAQRLRALRARLSAFEPDRRSGRALKLDDGRMDGCFLSGGLPLGCWHEILGEGVDADASAIPAAFTARLCAGLAQGGQVVWALRREDLYAPGLCELGLKPDRLLMVRTASEAETLAVLEDALSAKGVAAAVGEVERVGLTAGRRLQLACERRGATGLLLRRRLFGRPPEREGKAEPATAASRWRIKPWPSEPEAGAPGLGATRWAARLERTRGGRSGGWILEASDGAVPFRVVAELADHGLASTERGQDREQIRRRAG